MNINQLFEQGAKLGVVRITLGLDENAKPVVLAEQYIKDQAGNQTHTQHQVGAASHDAACLTMLHRARLCSGIFRPMTLCETLAQEETKVDPPSSPN